MYLYIVYDLNIFIKNISMYHPIDLENWDRKEIYTTFDGYTYTLTAELDVTEFLQTLKEKPRTVTACTSTRVTLWITSIFLSCPIQVLPDSAIQNQLLLQNTALPEIIPRRKPARSLQYRSAESQHP